jgi:hypothetical protein
MKKDLLIVVADKNMEFTLRGALTRHESLGIRPIEFEIKTHPGRDGGVRTNGPDFLTPHSSSFSHGILMFDYEGSGASQQTGAETEHELDGRLRSSWGDRAKAIVVEPEVDIWMWGATNLLVEIFEWNEGVSNLREWLNKKGYAFTPEGKPDRPKEALEAILRQQKQPRSASLYEKIASRIGLSKCQDPSFLRLRTQLQTWFPQNA